jgi:DNA/RNA-binding domain of Phe-tRNA-synthetase-like protein
MLTVAPHPLLDLWAFVTHFPRPLGEETTPAELRMLLSSEASAPWQRAAQVREAVRALLRQGGFKPSGRSKPASEYLAQAVAQGRLPGINPAVDICNLVSLHSGLPISVVDLDRLQAPFRVAVAPAGAQYVFNPAGQIIDLKGLLCLFDAAGPCGSPVKDAQRAKTSETTRRTLSLVWSTQELPDYGARVTAWYRQLLTQLGARTELVWPAPSASGGTTETPP